MSTNGERIDSNLSTIYPTIVRQSKESFHSSNSFYLAENLINEHLKRNWNEKWTKIVAIHQIVLGLIITIIGGLMIFFNLTLSSTGHALWTGLLIIIGGFLAFFTSFYRQHKFFLLVSLAHLIVGLVSALMIFISALSLFLQFNDPTSFHLRREDFQLNSALHVTLIILGVYEKLLCYSFLIMLVRHMRKMI